MPINAPYNFVPLSKNVYFPDWAEKISHDLPFKDGLSGTIELTLTAKTALSIGDAGDDFFQLPNNGKYAIPGSSIRGMIRSVFEIATFSKMQLVDNKTYNLRDFSGTHISKVYTKALINERDVGYMQLIEGKHTIIPCNYKKVSYLEYEDLVEVDLNYETVMIRNREKKIHKTTKNKYQLWDNAVKKIDKAELSKRFANIIDNKESFTPVFTGGIHGKEHDYIFYDAEVDPEKFIIITDKDPYAWNDLLETHGNEEKGRTAEPMAWPSYWEEKYYKGSRVPVFYKKDEKRLRIGLTYMLKFAGDNRVKDLIENTSSDHNSEKMDLTEAVFGRALESENENSHENEKGKLSLKSRVQFGLACHVNGDKDQKTKPIETVLASPKASYFPNYIKQSANALGKIGYQEQYATYLNYGDEKAEISGSKIYPVMDNNVEGDNHIEGDNQEIRVTLHTLPKGSTFKSTVNFHNLRPMELGALLWSINIDNRLHTLGGGKPIQLGQTKIDITNLDIIPNNIKSKTDWNQSNLAIHFKKEMNKTFEWSNSAQIQTLLAAKTPKRELKNLKFTGQLKYMKLKEFSTQKTNGFSLQPYRTTDNLALMIEREPITKSDEIWKKAKVQKDKNQLQITSGKLSANASMDMIKHIKLNKKQEKSLNNGTLFLDVEVESKGNLHTVKEINLPQP